MPPAIEKSNWQTRSVKFVQSERKIKKQAQSALSMKAQNARARLNAELSSACGLLLSYVLIALIEIVSLDDFFDVIASYRELNAIDEFIAREVRAVSI
jgi:hypothetical protein